MAELTGLSISGCPRGAQDRRGSAFLGWSPSCACPAADPVPCVVLDPFGGAGTVGLVADRLGRDAVLVDLNPQYSDLAVDRLLDDAPLFVTVSRS